MKAHLYWAVRDWLIQPTKMEPALPPNDKFLEEATEIKWEMQSNGKNNYRKEIRIRKEIKAVTRLL